LNADGLDVAAVIAEVNKSMPFSVFPKFICNDDVLLAIRQHLIDLALLVPGDGLNPVRTFGLVE